MIKEAVIEELSDFINDFPFAKEIKNKSFFITGATGFLGSAFVLALSEADRKYNLNLKISCFVRDINKAEELFGQCGLNYVTGDLSTDFELPYKVDYVIHCASPTSSEYFINYPVETFLDNINFTQRLVKKIIKTNCTAFLYLSSLEVYGTSDSERVLKENSSIAYSMHSVRNSYPLAKIAVEELLYMYYKEYGLPVKIARLTQTFGPGINYNDNRVFAQFARSVVENRNIILKSEGKTERNYCYVSDAVSALFYILFRGQNGEAYNVAGDNTYVSILDFAKLFGKYNDRINIEFQLEENSKTGYLPLNKVKLDNEKLKLLGWNSQNDILKMVNKFCKYFYDYLKETENK